MIFKKWNKERLKTKKALGVAGVSSESMRCCNNVVLSKITKLFNLILDSGYYTEVWNQAPYTQDVNWMYIRRSEDVLGVFWTSYVRSIYVLCLRGGLIHSINKSSSKKDPPNYQGITFLRSLGKLFSSLVYNHIENEI